MCCGWRSRTSAAEILCMGRLNGQGRRISILRQCLFRRMQARRRWSRCGILCRCCAIRRKKIRKKHPTWMGAAVGNLHGATVERIYVGPKELAVLETTAVPTIKNDHPDLRGLVDFGWWGVLARPLFLWLKWMYGHVVANWGWAIVLQTLIISLALMPLRITQMKSMLKMQRVAPQIKSIQDKYKKYSLRDPRKAGMNEEISALYKKEGVNPAGGCLPMLIQFPFLIAYYRMLGTALDLRHAHWLWISDLSA